MEPKSPTLDQIAVFLAIVETGSFAAAGRKLGRATSAISYAISNLESQLGLSLFARAGASKPRLTEAGRAILSDGRGLAMALDGLIAKARGLTQGLEAEVSLAVDVMWPAKSLVKALEEFRRRFPTVGLRLRVEALGAVTESVLDRSAAFGLSGPLEMANDLLIRGAAGAVKLIPVAHPDHPLAQMSRVTSVEAREHIQLVLTDRSPLTADRDFGRDFGEELAARRSWRQARPAAGGARLGFDAQAHGLRRHQARPAGQALDRCLGRCAISIPHRASQRHATRTRRLLADGAAGDEALIK